MVYIFKLSHCLRSILINTNFSWQQSEANSPSQEGLRLHLVAAAFPRTLGLGVGTWAIGHHSQWFLPLPLTHLASCHHWAGNQRQLIMRAVFPEVPSIEGGGEPAQEKGDIWSDVCSSRHSFPGSTSNGYFSLSPFSGNIWKPHRTKCKGRESACRSVTWYFRRLLKGAMAYKDDTTTLDFLLPEKMVQRSKKDFALILRSD